MDSELKNVLAIQAELGATDTGNKSIHEMRSCYSCKDERLAGSSIQMEYIKDLTSSEGVPLRQYRPFGLGDGLQAGLIYIHGGGWVMGGFASHDKVCRQLADVCRCLVIAIDYRLAPEHPFPAAPQDVISSTSWIAENAKEMGIDPKRLGIAGDSAGGSLTAVACLANRNQLTFPFCCQVLIYPSTDNSPEGKKRSSRVEQALTPPMSANAMQQMIDCYLPDERSSCDWRASPLLASDHSSLPPALIITGGYDPLRDEGIAYAHRLALAGVDVLHRHFAGQIHGFIELGGALSAVNEAMQTIAFWFTHCQRSS